MRKKNKYLFTAATAFEMAAFLKAWQSPDPPETLLSGVGIVESAMNLCKRLCCEDLTYTAVINFGIAGAYIDDSGETKAGLLDICLAEKEILADFGICLTDRISPFRENGVSVEDRFSLDQNLLARAAEILNKKEITATGTRRRGISLAQSHDALCENMEGAALARVCKAFALPLLEIRCISNMVEDRDRERWQIPQACQLAGEAVAAIAAGLVE